MSNYVNIKELKHVLIQQKRDELKNQYTNKKLIKGLNKELSHSKHKG